MGEECKVFIKVSLLCFSLAQGTILQPKLYLWCRREENLSFKLKNGQKWPFLAPLNVSLLVGKNFDSQNLF